MAIISISSNNTNLFIDTKPRSCPICHVVIDAKLELICKINQVEYECVFKCLIPECGHLFIGYYKLENSFYKLIHCQPLKAEPKTFPKEISDVSIGFINIYNQAIQAEVAGLSEICGVGYRKALEFLIKDYVISLQGDDNESIDKIKKNPSIYNIIQTYVENEYIKSTAKRAIWLGNDETHYTRKWTEKQIKDLKVLIELTTHWISLESITRDYEQSMPD